MSSPVQCLASEIAGLFQDHQARLKTLKASQLTLESYYRILPQHISAALQQCAMVSKEKMKCPNWKLWAYTDESCIGKAKSLIGAGVYCPQTKADCYVDSGGVGMTNTINRADLTGIAAALTNKYTQIATDSACSLSQIRKQLLFPEMQRDHIHSNLLEQIVSMIYASPEPICFY